MTLLALQERSLEPSRNPIRSLRFFSQLSPAAASDFDSLGRLSSPSRATILFKEHDLCRSVIFLHSGEVKLFSTSSKGRTIILKIARSGDLLGLAAAISVGLNEMTAQTLAPTLIKTIPSDDFLRFIDRHHGAQMQMTRLLAADCKSAFLDVRNIAYSTAPERIATILLNWGRSPLHPEPQLRFDMNLTHDELGNMAGLSRETITRILSGFQKKKLIQVHGTSFLILEPALLASLVA